MSAYTKNVFKTIGGNPRRYVSVLLVTALGVAFFLGLRSTSPDMNYTLDAYFEEQNMYDVRLLSSLGLTEENMDALRGLPGVAEAAPAYYCDQFAQIGGSGYLVRIHSADISLWREGRMLAMPALLEGRIPENSGECAVENRFADIAQLEIGDNFTLFTGDDTLISDALATDTYTITGFVESPQYLRADLGSSAKGSGSLNAYMYVPSTDFTAEVYTEAYVRFEDARALSRFDEAYGDLAGTMKTALEAKALGWARTRRDEIIKEAETAIAEAEAEMDDARVKLEEGRQTLLDGERELKDGEQALAENRASFEKEIAEAEDMLEKGRAQLRAGEEEWAAGRQALDEGYVQLETQKATFFTQMEAMGIPDVSLLPEPLAGAYAALLENEAALAESERLLALTKKELAAGEKELAGKKAEGEAALREAEEALEAARGELADGRAEYETEKAEADEKLAEGEEEIREAREALSELPEAKAYALGLSENIGFSSFEQDSLRVASLSVVFPIIFFLVAALVAFTSMVRLVEDDRATSGTLLSLGYGPVVIVMKYVLYALAVSIPGGVLGIAAGFRLFPAIIFNNGYRILYLMPSIQTPLQWDICVYAILSAVASVLAPTVIVCTREMFLTPATLMRPKSPPPGRRVLLEYIPFFWKRMSFSAKVTARNILRYKKRFFMTVAGILGCTALVLTGFGVRDSIRSIADKQFGYISLYELQITLSESATDEQLVALEGFLDDQPAVRERLHAYKVSLTAGSGEQPRQEVSLVVPGDMERVPDFIRLPDYETGDILALTDTGAVISEKLSEVLDVYAGDTLLLTTDGDRQTEVVVDSVCENYVGHYVYLSPALYRQLYGTDPETNTVLCLSTAQDRAEEEALSTELLKNPAVSGLSFTSTLKDFYTKTIESLGAVVVVLILSGALLAFVVLFSLTSINIDERRREIATLKVLGFYDEEASAYIFRENVINTVIGMALGLLVGVFLHRYVMNTMEIDFMMFGKQISPWSFVYSGLLTLAFMFIVNFVAGFSIRKVDMVSSLKSVE